MGRGGGLWHVTVAPIRGMLLWVAPMVSRVLWMMVLLLLLVVLLRGVVGGGSYGGSGGHLAL